MFSIHWLTQIHDLFDRLATCLYTNTSYFKPGNDPLSSGKGVPLCSKNIRKGNTAFKFQNIVRTIVKVKCVGDRKLIIFFPQNMQLHPLTVYKAKEAGIPRFL